MSSLKPRIAVIGAGVAGLTAARQLAQVAEVTVFEKSRGVGGRLAHRVCNGFAFDSGAQFFTARGPSFIAEIDQLEAAGLVRRWHVRFAEISGHTITLQRDWGNSPAHYIGSPRMKDLAVHWARGLTVHLETRITELLRQGGVWRLEAEAGKISEAFDFVILAIPSPQVAGLIDLSSPVLDVAKASPMQACFALMIGLGQTVDPGFDVAVVQHSNLSFLSLPMARPDHSGGPGIVALSSNRWADANIDRPLAQIADDLRAALIELIGPLPAIIHEEVHRWRYANCPPQRSKTPLIDEELGLALIGDWTRHGRVEAAYLSGREVGIKLAERCQ